MSRRIENGIYIPIWLDLLLAIYIIKLLKLSNLHSNMVRFIIHTTRAECLRILYLHSNMVRFIIFLRDTEIIYLTTIYIPIWLDLLSEEVLAAFGVAPAFTFQYG